MSASVPTAGPSRCTAQKARTRARLTSVALAGELRRARRATTRVDGLCHDASRGTDHDECPSRHDRPPPRILFSSGKLAQGFATGGCRVQRSILRPQIVRTIPRAIAPALDPRPASFPGSALAILESVAQPVRRRTSRR